MEIINQNLYIVEENPLTASNLQNFLKKRFKDTLTISTFIDGQSVLEKIDLNTSIVILDYDLKGERADKLLIDIKNRNPNTEVIILSSDTEIGTAIDAYRFGAKGFIRKDSNQLKRILSVIYKVLYYPVEVTKRFFGLQELFAIFVVEVVYIGLVVFIGMKLFT